MRAPRDRDRRFPAGPEILSLAVLALAALLIAAALGYSWLVPRERAAAAGEDARPIDRGDLLR